MALKVLNQSLEIEKLVGIHKSQVLLRAEALVPGAGREAITPLMAEADLVIGNVDVQLDRVVTDGIAYCQAIYRQGDESTLRALTAQSTLNHVFDAMGVAPGMPTRVDGQVEHVEAKYENGHMVFYITVGLSSQVLTLEQTEVDTGLAGVENLEANYAEIFSTKLAAESDTTVTLQEEVALPAALDARMALMDWASVTIEQSSADLGGVRVSGKMNLECLISSGVAGRPVALIKYPLAFDQMIELPEWLSSNVHASASIRRLLTQVDQGMDGEDSVLRIEAELKLSVQAMTTDSVTALTDAYTTGGTALKVKTKSVDITSSIENIQHSEAFKGTVMLPENAPGIGTVLAVRVRPNLSGWSSLNGNSKLEGILEATILYMPAGSDKLTSAQTELPFEVTCKGNVGADSWVWVESVSADANALMSDRVELRCNLLATAQTRVVEKEMLAVDVEELDEARRRPGIVLFWPGEEDSVWSIGKRYNVPIGEVLAMNGGTSVIRRGKALVLKI